MMNESSAPKIMNHEKKTITASLQQTDSTISLSKQTSWKSNTQKPSIDSFQSMDISDITLEIEKLEKLAGEDPEQALKGNSKLIRDIDQQMEISFEIIEERQNMVLEYLKERAKADKQSRRRADEIMKQFTTTMNYLDSTINTDSAHEKVIKSMITQTDCILTKNQALQTTFSDSISPKSKQNTARYMPSENLSLPEELDILCNISFEGNKITEDKAPVPLLTSGYQSKTKDDVTQKQNKNMKELRTLCRHMDNLETSIEKAYNILEEKLHIPSRKVDELVNSFKGRSPRSRENKISKQLRTMAKETKMSREDISLVKKKLIEIKNIKEKIEKAEDKLKGLLKNKFSLASAYSTSTIVSTNICSNDLTSQTITEREAYSFQKDSLATASTERDISKSERLDLISELSTDEDEEIDKQLKKLISGGKSEEEKYEILKKEKQQCEKSLAEASERAKENAYQIKVRKEEKKEILENKGKIIEEKSTLEGKLKQINKNIYENLLVDEKEKEKKEAEQRLSDVTKHIEVLENNLSTSSAPIKPNKSLSEKSDYLANLKNNLDKLIPYAAKLSPKYYRKMEKINKVPKAEDVDDILKKRSELSKKLLHVENQIQMIITSKDFLSDDEENTVTSLSDTSRPSKKSVSCKKNEIEKEKTKINEAIVQLELELHSFKSNTAGNEDLLKKENSSLKKRLNEIRKLIKTASQIPRPIEENKQLKILKEQIELIRQECINNGIKNFSYDKKYLEQLKAKKKEYEGKVEKIRNRIENENVHGKNIGNILKDMLHERHRLTSVNLSIQNDIDNLQSIKNSFNDESNMKDILSDLEKEILDFKSRNLFHFLIATKTQVSQFLDSLKTNLKLQIEEREELSEKDEDCIQKEKFKAEFISVKNIIDNIIYDLNATESNDLKNINIDATSQSVKNILSKKFELEKTLQQINQSIENKIATTHNKELLKQLLKKKIETKDQLNENGEKIRTQNFLLKEKLKKYVALKQNIEKKLENVSMHDIQDILNTMEGTFDESQSKDTLFSLVQERESVAKNLSNSITQEENQRRKSNNVSKVLDSLDAVILNQLQNIVRHINDINSHSNSYVAFTIEKDKLKMLLQYDYELNKIMKSMNNISVDESKLKTLDPDILKDLEKKKKVVEDFKSREIEVTHLDILMQFQELNNQKVDRLLSKIKSLNTLLQTQRKTKIHKNKSMQFSTNNVKVLKMTAEKIGKELESLVQSFQLDISEENPFEAKVFNSLSLERKEGLSILLHERDAKLHELFFIEKQLLTITIGTPKFIELSKKKENLEKQIDIFDNKIIECDFSVTQETYMMPTARTFSPKSTSSRHSFVIALDERDAILKKIFDLTKEMELKKANECFSTNTCEINLLKTEIETLKNQLSEIDDKLLEGATLDDDSLNQTLISSNPVTKKVLLKDLESVKNELQTDKLKLHSPKQPDSSPDLRYLITDSKESDVFDALESVKAEMRKEKLKEYFNSLEEEKYRLEEDLRGRKSPDRMLLRKEEEEIKEELEQNQIKLSEVIKKRKIESELKLLKNKKLEHQENIEKEEEDKFNSFLKNEKSITIKEYKKNKVTLEHELDAICSKMAQYSKALEIEVKRIEREISQSSAPHSYRKTIEWSFEIDDGLDALRGHQCELKEYINKLKTAEKDSYSEKTSMNVLLKQRSEIVKKLTKITDRIKKLKLEKKEDLVTKNLNQLFSRSKEILKLQKFLKLKISAIDIEIGKLKKFNPVKENSIEISRLKTAIGEEIWNGITENQELDILMEAKGKSLYQYIQELKIKAEKNDNHESSINFKNNNKSSSEIDELSKTIKSMKEETNKLKQELFTSNKEIEKQKQLINQHLEERESEKIKWDEEKHKLILSNTNLKGNEEAHLQNIKELQKVIQELKRKTSESEISNAKNIGNQSGEGDVFPVILDINDTNNLLKNKWFENIIKDIDVLENNINIYKNKIQEGNEKEQLLIKKIEKQEKLFIAKELEIKEAKNCISDIQSHSSNMKSQLNLFRNIIFDIREEKDSLQKELNDIQKMNTNVQIQCNAIEHDIEQSNNENRLFKEKIETINNEISTIKANRICNNLNGEKLNDKQNTIYHDENGKCLTLDEIFAEKECLKEKMDSLWNEIVKLKQELSHQKEVDRKEKEKLNEKLSVYIEKLEQDKKLKENEAEELSRLKSEVQKYLYTHFDDEKENTERSQTESYKEVIKLKESKRKLEDQLNQQKEGEITLLSKQKEIQRELDELKQQNVNLNQKVKSLEINKNIGVLKKDIVSRKEVQLYCIPKEEIIEKVFQLQKLNVILELKSVFSTNKLKNAKKKLSDYVDPEDTMSFAEEPVLKQPVESLAKENNANKEVEALKTKNKELQKEVDRCKRIIFKKGRTSSNMSNYKETPSFDSEQVTQESINDVQANPTPSKKALEKPVKEEELDQKIISDDVKQVLNKVLRVVAQPVPCQPIDSKTDYSKLKKEEIIEQDTVSELMLSDDAAIQSNTSRVKSLKEAKERQTNELRSLKEELANAKEDIERLKNERKFYDHDISILKDEKNAIENEKKRADESHSLSEKRLKEKNIKLDKEYNQQVMKNKDLDNKLEDASNSLTRLQKSYDNLKASEKNLEKENETFKMKLFKTETELEKEKENYKKIKNEFTNLQNEADTNLEKYSNLQSDMKLLQNKLDNTVKDQALKKKESHANTMELQRKIHEVQKYSEDLEIAIEKLNEVNENLKNQLDEKERLAKEANEDNKILSSKQFDLEVKAKEYENRIYKLEKDKIALENKLTDEFDEKNKNLKELHENLKNALASKTKTIESTKELESRLNGKINRLKDRVKQLDDENKDFALRLQEKTNIELKNKDLSRNIDQYKYQINELKDTNEKTKQELENSKEKNKALKSRIESLEKICGDELFVNLKENVSDISIGDKNEDPYTKYVKSMLKERKSLDRILKEIYDENKTMEIQIKNVQENLKQMKKDRDGKILSLETTKKKLEEKILKTEKEKEDALLQNDQLLDEIKQYCEKNDSLDITIQRYRKQEEEMKLQNKKLIADLNHHVEILESSEKEVDNLREMLDEKERSLKDLHFDLQNTKHTTDKIEEEIRVLNEEKYNAMNDIDKTKAEYEVLQAELTKSNNEKSIAANNNESLKIELKKLSREIEILHKENENKSQNYLEKEKELMDLKKLNKMLELDVAQYNETIKKINKEDAELIKELETEKTALKTQLNGHQKNVNDLVQNNSKLKDDFILLNEKLEFTEQKLMKAEREISILKEVLDSQKSVTDELKSHLNSERNAKKDLQEKLRVVVKEKGNLNDKYTKQSVELAFLRETIESIKISKNEIQSQLDDLNDQVRQTNKQREILQDEMEKETKLNETYEDNIFSLTQSNKILENDLTDSKETILKLKENINYLEEQKEKVSQNYDTLKLELVDMKDKYQSLEGRYQHEISSVNKELNIAKKKLEEQRTEINHINEHTELEIKGQLKIIKEAFENEKNNQTNLINDLKDRLAAKMLSANDNSKIKEIAELEEVKMKLENRCNELQKDKQDLIEKLNQTTDNHDREITETRKQLTEKFKKNIDKLSLKSKDLSNEIIDMERIKNQLEVDRNSLLMENKKIITENSDLKKTLDDKSIQLEEKERVDKIRESTLKFELDGLRLENNDLLEQVKHLKYQINKNELYKQYEKEIQEQKKQLEMSMREFEEEKSNFEANIEEIFMRSNEMYVKSEFEKNEKIKSEKLKACQEEKDNLNSEINKLNKELLNAKNEIRKLKTRIQEKEEEFLIEEKKTLSNVEKEWKAKLDEANKSHAKEKSNLMAMNQDDRYKFEQEMESLKIQLKEDTNRKLTEQREDFEKELKEHIYQYLRQNQEEVDELLDKNETLKTERLDLIRQYENERIVAKRKHDSERYALVETIRRLLKNVMKFKAQKVKLKHSHRDEITDLEERFEIEREKLEEKCEQEIELLRENLHRSQRFQDHKEEYRRLDDDAANLDYRYGPIRIKPEKESDAVSLTKIKKSDNEKLKLPEISEIVKITESSDENNSDSDAEYIRTQYECELRRETDALMKRLLEISDELDSLRSTT